MKKTLQTLWITLFLVFLAPAGAQENADAPASPNCSNKAHRDRKPSNSASRRGCNCLPA